MTAGQNGEVTRLLFAWRNGDPADELVAVVYEELRRIAKRYLSREKSNHTLQPTAVVHEAYLRLVDQRTTDWQDRGHFFAVASQAMRRILIDHARKHRYVKRGGGSPTVPLAEAGYLVTHRPKDLIDLDDSLTGLSTVDPAKARLVELRFFGGLSLEETAEILGCSRTTVARQWRMAQTWLYREMTRSQS